MFNLLPESEKKQILDEYNARKVAVALFFLFVIGLISVISIFPSYVLSMSKVMDAENSLASEQKSPVFQDESQLSAQLSQVNAKLLALRPQKSDVDMAALIQTAIDHRSPKIRLDGFSFVRGSGSNADKLTVTGIAASRVDLSSFVDSLKTDPMFSGVNLPVSSFAKDQNAEFSLDITGSF